MTAAHWAAWTDRPEMLKFISSKGGSLLQENNEGYSPFDLAIINNSQQVVKWFVSQHKEYFVNIQGVNENTPLLLALAFNHSEMAQFLIEQGADVNAKNNTGLTPLNATALTNNVEIAQLLVKKGANLDDDSYFSTLLNPLHLAASNNNIEMAQFLIEQGLDVNKPAGKIKYLNVGLVPLVLIAVYPLPLIFGVPLIVGGSGSFMFVADGEREEFHSNEHYQKIKDLITNVFFTPLHLAAFKGHSEMVDLLIQYGADVGFESSTDYTAFHFAVQEGHSDIVKILVNNHADVNAISDDGTPLHIAVANNNIDMVNFLLTEVNANPNVTAEFDVEDAFLDVEKTPLDIALEKGFLHVANILQNHGAQ